MSSFRTGLKYWMQLFLVPLYLLVHLMPRSKNIWVFGSTFGRRFSDNPKYLYLYLNEIGSRSAEKNRVRPIWITKTRSVEAELSNKGLPVYYLYSLNGIWHCLRAKVYIFDNYSKDISFTLSGGAVKINLWHGIPLKKINWDNLFDTVRHPNSAADRFKWMLRRMTDEKPSHYVLCTSEHLRSIFSSAFQTKKVITSGYPRNDMMAKTEGLSETEKNSIIRVRELAGSNESETVRKRIREKKEKLIYYMPTFRDSEAELLEILRLEELDQFLKIHQYYLIMKFHPKSKAQQLLSEKMKDKSFSQISILGQEEDPYPILLSTDVLITDYSSIYFDFLLLNRPIIFWDFDRKEYLEHSREFYFEYSSFTPGRKVQSQEDLELAIEAAVLMPEEGMEQRMKLLNQFFDETKGLASERLYQEICRIIRM